MEQDDSSALSIRYCIGCTSLSSLAASFIFLLAKTIYLCRNKYFKIDLWHSSYFLLCHLIFKGNNCHLDSSFSALTMLSSSVTTTTCANCGKAESDDINFKNARLAKR